MPDIEYVTIKAKAKTLFLYSSPHPHPHIRKSIAHSDLDYLIVFFLWS